MEGWEDGVRGAWNCLTNWLAVLTVFFGVFFYFLCPVLFVLVILFKKEGGHELKEKIKRSCVY